MMYINLAVQMSNGLTAHAADFPNVDPIVLSAAFSDYLSSRTSAESARSTATVAIASKQDALAELEDTMKKLLKIAEFDCAGDPAKLAEIGWGPKAAPTATTAPNQPTDFICSPQGDHSAGFQWKKAMTGCKATCFILQRRQIDPTTQEYGSWQLVDFYYDNMITVENQPTGVKREFRVIASNPAGQSLPSNTASVVL